jgi:GDP/UDP-N,N'-diacetylbacillosamine 2-epimerase (hydrolysing)
MIKRKICIVSGSRAEYGLLRSLMFEVQKSKTLDLQVIATGMHLSSEYGLTFNEIVKDGFSINHKVEMLISSDKPSSISKSTALGLIGISDALDQLKPDLLVVLGDRFEIYAAGIAALFSRIPIAHIHGGETTVGAFDESIRHSLTKMAWWHFVAAKEYEKRVIQLGEEPSRVFNVGGLGVDAIKKAKLLSKKELELKTGLKFLKKNLIITYHPVTLEDNTSKDKFQELINAIEDFKDIYIIFTMPNADSNSKVINKMILEFVSKHKQRSIAFTSLGHLNYLSTMQFVDGVVGNSSSGLAEAPTFKIGTINLGDRQKGRLRSNSVIDTKSSSKQIKNAIKKLYSKNFKKILKSVINPYGNGLATKKIISILKNKKLPYELKKEFYDL